MNLESMSSQLRDQTPFPRVPGPASRGCSARTFIANLRVDAMRAAPHPLGGGPLASSRAGAARTTTGRAAMPCRRMVSVGGQLPAAYRNACSWQYPWKRSNSIWSAALDGYVASTGKIFCSGRPVVSWACSLTRGRRPAEIVVGLCTDTVNATTRQDASSGGLQSHLRPNAAKAYRHGSGKR